MNIIPMIKLNIKAAFCLSVLILNTLAFSQDLESLLEAETEDPILLTTATFKSTRIE